MNDRPPQVDSEAIVEMIERYGDARGALALADDPDTYQRNKDQADDLLTVIRAALTPVPQGDFREAPFCQIDPDNRPSPFSRQTAEHAIFRVIADRLEQQRILEENEQADKRFRNKGSQGKATGEPCNCPGFSHSKDCPNWELPD